MTTERKNMLKILTRTQEVIHQNALRITWSFLVVLMLGVISVGPQASAAEKHTVLRNPVPLSAPAPKVRVNFTAAKDSTDDFSTPPATDLADPVEPINRIVFAINDGLDFILLRPIAFVYKTVLPGFVRRAVGNFLSNVATPITLTNDLLQGEWDRAGNTLIRFAINTTAGIGGLDDLAARAGYPRHYEDFGQTLGKYGVPSGPYLVLPIIGPATPRHLVGRVADMFLNPWTYILYDEDVLIRLIPSVVELINTRAENLETLDSIRSTSTDYYTSIKSIYWQNRKSEIANGRIVVEELPDIPN